MVSTAISFASSTVACIAFVICSFEDFPTMHTYSVSASINACTCGSLSAFKLSFLVDPKLTSFALARLSSDFAFLKK